MIERIAAVQMTTASGPVIFCQLNDGVGFVWLVGWYYPHTCSVLGVERCHDLTGRKHGDTEGGTE